MEKEQTFSKFIEYVCEKPSMYCGKSNFDSLSSFINGYIYAKKTPISERDFDQFVCLKNSVTSGVLWNSVIENCTKNDEEAIAITKNTILEFIKLKSKLSKNELMQFAIDIANVNEDEPEKTLRKFDNAFAKGVTQTIQDLITDKEKTEELLNGKYPDPFFIDRLNRFDLYNKSIKRTFESENGKTIEFLISGWSFPVEVVLIKSQWKINVNQIIELRNSA